MLFIAVAIAEGIGDPSIPSDAVAVVEEAPEGIGTVTEKEFQHGIVQAAASSGIKPVPKPGDEQYEGLKETALGEMLQSIWLQGQAAEMGIEVTPKEVNAELEKIKEQSFESSEKKFQEFLKESHFTQADVINRVKLQVLSNEIQEQIRNETSPPTSGEIQEYYEAAKASQFTTPESRDIRLVVNKDKSKVEEAKAALEKDDSVESWEKVAKKYSSDPATKNKGGLQSAITEGGVSEPLDAEVFAAEQGELTGPLKESRGFVIFEVAKIAPAKVQELETVKSQIGSQLEEQASQQSFSRFVRNWESLWRSRTFCSEDVAIQRCANFPESGRPAEANPACYEANPKEAPEACPALITQVKPALPGSVSVLEPQGKQLPQRPRPAGGEEAAAAPEGLGLPPGVEGAPEGK
ncbi:MAG TPA: peptidyl-prolyl cis-trans isomerase [Solirubrobacterales bacterium]